MRTGTEHTRAQRIKSAPVEGEDNHFKRFIHALRSLSLGRSAGTSRRRPVVAPEADGGISVQRAFLGSTLELMQREYFRERQPRRDQQHDI
jgi:hypothetical protein